MNSIRLALTSLCTVHQQHRVKCYCCNVFFLFSLSRSFFNDTSSSIVQRSIHFFRLQNLLCSSRRRRRCCSECMEFQSELSRAPSRLPRWMYSSVCLSRCMICSTVWFSSDSVVDRGVVARESSARCVLRKSCNLWRVSRCRSFSFLMIEGIENDMRYYFIHSAAIEWPSSIRLWHRKPYLNHIAPINPFHFQLFTFFYCFYFSFYAISFISHSFNAVCSLAARSMVKWPAKTSNKHRARLGAVLSTIKPKLISFFFSASIKAGQTKNGPQQQQPDLNGNLICKKIKVEFGVVFSIFFATLLNFAHISSLSFKKNVNFMLTFYVTKRHSKHSSNSATELSARWHRYWLADTICKFLFNSLDFCLASSMNSMVKGNMRIGERKKPPSEFTGASAERNKQQPNQNKNNKIESNSTTTQSTI